MQSPHLNKIYFLCNKKIRPEGTDIFPRYHPNWPKPTCRHGPSKRDYALSLLPAGTRRSLLEIFRSAAQGCNFSLRPDTGSQHHRLSAVI